MDIDDLFAEANVVSTAAVARFVDVSEATAREWADELTVARIGASFAWTREDVEKLVEGLESEAEDDSDDDEDGDEDDDPDEEDDEEAEDEDEDDEEGDAA